MQNINVLLFVRSLSLANLSFAVEQGRFVVRFPTGHYRQCNWPVEKVSPGMCSCKWWTFWTTFVKKLANNLHFSCVVSSVHCVRFFLCWCLMVDRPTLLNSERTKSKMLIFCIVLLFALFSWHLRDICWLGDKKSHLKVWNVLCAWKVQNLILNFPR